MKRLELSFNVIVVTSAAAAVMFALRDRVGSTSEQPGPALAYVDEWQNILRVGIALGDPAAKVKIAVFSDFQCPSCRRFDDVTRSVEDRYRGSVSRFFVHFPLQAIHIHALSAARAAECADAQSRFKPIHDLLYTHQDSVTAGTWAALAQRAGVKDLIEFDRCVRKEGIVPRIDSGIALARRLGVRGTPTVLVNGWRFESPPTERQLSEVIDDLLAGRRPGSSSGAPDSR